MRQGNDAGLSDASMRLASDPAVGPDVAASGERARSTQTAPLLESEAALESALRSLPKRRAPRDLVDRIMARAERATDLTAG